MADIAELGFKVDTKGLKKGETALKDFSNQGEMTEKKVESSSKGIVKSFGSIAGAIGLIATATAGLSKVVAVTREFDVLNAQLITATGSAENAAKAFEGIQKFAATTPFDLAQTTEAFTKLVGIGLDPSERALTSLGNTAAAKGKPLMQLIEAVGDAATGEFERLKEFDIKTKQSADSVAFTFRGVTTTVKKEADAIQEFLIGLGENQFAGAMAERMKTLDGAMSNLGDSWDKLFLSISNQGVGDAVEDSVRLGISVLEEMNDFIESGQLQASIDFIKMKFSTISDPVVDGVRFIIDLFSAGSDIWAAEVEQFADFFGETFTNMPENIKAVIQLIGVEIASIVTFAEEFGAAFGKVLGVKMAQVVEEMKLFGQAIAHAIDPFAEGEFDLDGELERLRALSAEMTDSILANAEAAAERQTQIRRDSIEQILLERDAAILASDEQIAKIDQMREAFDAMKQAKAADKSDSLAGFGPTKKQQKDAEKFTKQQMKDLEKLEKQVDKFGGAWTKTGSAIIDAFGDIADSFKDYMDRLDDIAKMEEELAKQREVFGKDHEKVIEIEAQLSEERTNAELDGIKSLASAGEGLFKEKTAAAKTFAALQKMIAVAEIAMTFQKITASNQETATHVANETTKQGSNALSAITSAFNAPWPINFVSGAAMIAIMASLLGGSGGGGGGPSGSGTGMAGTAKGGKPSESLEKSNERLEDIMIDQLAELRGLRGDLSNVRNLAFGLLDDLLAVDLGHSEIKNATERELEESIRGLNAGAASGDFTDSLRAIFTGVTDAINESMSVLGMSTNAVLSDFFFEIGTISFDELSAEEAGERLNQILSGLSDQMVEQVAPFVTEFQQMGEGALETLVRLAAEQAVFNDTLDNFGMSIANLSEVMQIQVAQSIIDATGGFDEFSDLSSTFFKSFFSEAEQLSVLEGSLSDVFEQLGISMVHTREEFKALVQGIDLTTAEGQELFATLLEITPAMDEYLEALEEIESQRVDMTIELLELQGKSEEALAMQREIALAGMDESLHALQLLIWAEEDRIDALEEQEKLLKEQQKAAEDSFSMLEKAIEIERGRAEEALAIAQEAHEIELERIEGLRAALESEKALREENFALAETALNEAFDAEIKRIQDKANSEAAAIQQTSSVRISALNAEKSTINSTANAMRSLVSKINKTLGLDGSMDLMSALASAQAGDFTQAQALNVQGLANLDPTKFSSAEDFKVQQAVNRHRLATIAGLAGQELSEAEQMLKAIESQVQSTKDGSAAQVAAIKAAAQSEVDQLNAQRNAILGIDDTVLSVSEAITKFQQAQFELDDLNYEQELAKLDELEQSANDVFALHEQAYHDEMARLDMIIEDNQALLNAALGIDDSVLSVADAIASLEQAINVLNGEDESTTVGTKPIILPTKPPAKPPTIDPTITPPFNPDEQEMRDNIRDLVEQNRMFSIEIVRNTKSTARILQRIEYDGLDTRAIE